MAPKKTVGSGRNTPAAKQSVAKKAKTAPTHHKKNKKRRQETFSVYIYRVLK
jgi:hypothetical protein